jgi:parvulin-like peptidyl-prolyl isomerase
MIRRILAGAAIAATAFGFSASAASADLGPNPNNSGQALLSQFQIIDDALNDVLNHSVNDLEVEIINILDEVDLQLLNNNQPTVGDHNKDTEIDNGHAKSE